MKRITDWLDQKYYPGLSANWSDCLFREAVLRKINRDTHLLDLGAGAGIIAEMNFKDVIARACGVDPDPRVMRNPYLQEAKVGAGNRIPYPDSEFDVVLANNVLEHLQKPIEVFREIIRVLKPGGLFIAKTPNRNHYVPVIARVTPVSFHRFYGRLLGREADDTFPTFYRANSRSQIEVLADSTGFQIDALDLIEKRPEYLRISPATYVLGICYERTVNATWLLANWRVLLISELRKPIVARRTQRHGCLE
jgi:SAM-dependent methyltransferase